MTHLLDSDEEGAGGVQVGPPALDPNAKARIRDFLRATPKKRGRKPKHERLRIQQEEEAAGIVTVKEPRKKKTLLIKSPRLCGGSEKGVSAGQQLCDVDDLPLVRFPEKDSVPTHLAAELFQLFPRREVLVDKEKKTLDAELPMSENIQIFMRRMAKSDFWTPALLNRLAKILLGRSNTTLSHINWLNTGYSRYQKVSWLLDGHEFNVASEHFRQMHLNLHPYFDEFARDQRLLVEYVDTEEDPFWDTYGDFPDKTSPQACHFQWDRKKLVGVRYLRDPVNPSPKRMIYLVTSYGQLNFFRWAFPNKVIDYAEEHHMEIDRHMDEVKENTKKVGKGKRRKLCDRKYSPPVQFFKGDEQIGEEEGGEGVEFFD